MPRQGTIRAVLGPTNTGKTRFAMDEMLRHKTGMIGLPLRLLAREVYDQVIQRTSPDHVALVTGEEKIVPPGTRYWICTTEAMPMGKVVEFIAIDEIQLCADYERGHTFTDRMLHARGLKTTLFLGSETMQDVIATLVPETQFETRGRFSRLTWAGTKKVSKLPKRSAIIGFSADMVYSLAELLRRQRGGAAVVMGALSPRTRNAQVALYQSGEVDFLVATDAIGMGLNMDIDHVAFAALRKFDGVGYRHLSPAELGQIAGRAGRYKTDGTFGVTAGAPEPDADTVSQLESHDFDNVKTIRWRNRDLDFSSLTSLRESLAARPRLARLVKAKKASDETALEILATEPDVIDKAQSPETVAALWNYCQLPDFRNISAHNHAAIISRIFEFCTGPKGKIDTDWFARQLSHCDQPRGDIDTLSTRIAHSRTWTFVANRSNWIDDAAYWRERTAEIENRLSDALHEALTQRFIDRRTSYLMGKLRQRKDLMSAIDENGTVSIEDQPIGRLIGFRFTPEGGEAALTGEVKAAADKIINREITARVATLTAVPDTEIKLDTTGRFIWHDAPIARLIAGDDILKPGIKLLADEHLQTEDQYAVRFRLQKFLDRHIKAQLEPLIAIHEDESLEGLAKGLGFRLRESLGVIERGDVAGDLKSLDQTARGSLRKHGVRFGGFHLFIPALLKPAPTSLRLLLAALKESTEPLTEDDPRLVAPGQGLTSAPANPGVPADVNRIAGFKQCGNRIVRVDMLERLGDLIRKRVFWRPQTEDEQRPEGSVEGGGFTVVPDMMSLVGCSGEEFSDILKALGFRVERRPLPEPAEAEKPAEPIQGEQVEEPAEPQALEVWWPRGTGPFRNQQPKGRRPQGKHPKKPKDRPRPKAKKQKAPANPEDSPFAALAALKKNMNK